MIPRLGVLAYHPIQYHAPLHQLLAKRGNVELDVMFLSDTGSHPAVDPGFGIPVSWDIDLLSGYAHRFLTRTGSTPSAVERIGALARWLPAHDAVVINGYNSPWMLMAMALCRMHRVPYLLRASSHPQGRSTGVRRYVRRVGTRLVVAGSAGGLAMGLLNQEFYLKRRARSIIFAPNSIDDERFACPPQVGRSDLLAGWGLKDNRPVIAFCGKLIPRKRPLDLAAAVRLLPFEVITLFVGDGSLADSVRAALIPGSGVVTGFVNQADLPSYYHAADILVLPSESETWGLVVNEAMACGALPVVSDRVGCAPDLASGVGELFPYGDVQALAGALRRAVARLDDARTRGRIRQHIDRYSLARTAAGFEQAAHDVAGRRDRARQSSLAPKPDA
jgi:glycosyltransferase involved in cell wall biosynthesis